MKEIQLFLIPAPGAKPEFVAKIRPVSTTDDTARNGWNAAPSTVTLEGYTRDSWAWKPSTGSSNLVTLTTESTDGRKKLPGFVKYLRERQKSAYGRFSPTGVWVISYVQPSKHEDQLECRIALDLRTIPGCKLQPKQNTATAKPHPQVTTTKSAATTTTTTTKRKGGLLGQLVGAQQRTNRHVAQARQQPKAAAAAAPTRTAQDVFLAFREQCNQTMLDFDLATHEDVKKISITLQEQQTGLSDAEKPKVTMEVLKYMVYEAAEEVNEEWIAYKEPTDFIDECVIAVYKEGAAPPEVLEDVNKGDLPDEAIGQQRAMAEQRERQELAKAAKRNEMMEQRAHLELNDDEEELAALNTNKRDRRTVEDFERERKRGKS